MPQEPVLTIEERLRGTQERAAVLCRHLMARAVEDEDNQEYLALDIDAFRGLALIGEALYDDVRAIVAALSTEVRVLALRAPEVSR